MKNVFTAVLCAALLCVSAFAQAALPDQAIFGGFQYSQQSAPQAQGFAGYAKLVDSNSGTYSYTRFVETSVKIKPTVAIQTQTETGVCSLTSKWGSFDIFTPLTKLGFTHVFACGTGGIAAAGGSVGASGSGTVLAMRDLQKGWSVGIGVSPSYSAVTGKVSYPAGLVVSWGR